jgi:hypothetical protein
VGGPNVWVALAVCLVPGHRGYTSGTMPPRTKPKQEVAEEKPKRTRASVAKPKKGRAAAAIKSSTKKPTGKAVVGRTPTSVAVQRNQQIVEDREIDCMTWGEIARKHKVTEKTAREGYKDYVANIAPLVQYEQGFEKAREFVRVMEGVRSRLQKIAADPTSGASARVAAYNSVVASLMKEIEFRQMIGLLPRNLRDLSQVIERGWVARQVIELLDDIEAPEEAYVKLHEIMVAAQAS